jgi:hypothetical protein
LDKKNDREILPSEKKTGLFPVFSGHPLGMEHDVPFQDGLLAQVRPLILIVDTWNEGSGRRKPFPGNPIPIGSGCGTVMTLDGDDLPDPAIFSLDFVAHPATASGSVIPGTTFLVGGVRTTTASHIPAIAGAMVT